MTNFHKFGMLWGGWCIYPWCPLDPDCKKWHVCPGCAQSDESPCLTSRNAHLWMHTACLWPTHYFQFEACIPGSRQVHLDAAYLTHYTKILHSSEPMKNGLKCIAIPKQPYPVCPVAQLVEYWTPGAQWWESGLEPIWPSIMRLMPGVVCCLWVLQFLGLWWAN